MTQIVILAVVAGLIAYGAWAAITKKQSTISSVITKYSFKYPIIPFILGALVGHWLWK